MIYSKKVRDAFLICFNAHKEDYDKAGDPYVFHPFFLASQMDDEDTTIVALLHDVIEDHGDQYDLNYFIEKGWARKFVRRLIYSLIKRMFLIWIT